MTLEKDFEIVVNNWLESVNPPTATTEDIKNTEKKLAAYLYNQFNIEFKVKLIKNSINGVSVECEPVFSFINTK